MYDQNFKNQAVKECVNGQGIAATARKFSVSKTALNGWIKDYKKRMASMKLQPIDDNNMEAVKHKENDERLTLNSVNINIDGYDITISKEDIFRIMGVFDKFEE